jgi:dienelactone hydrolase
VRVDRDDYRREEPLDYINRFFVRNVANLRMLLDELPQRSELRVDAARMATLGISLGGIRSSILFGLDRRIRAAVLVVAGAELPSLLAKSILTPIKQWRDYNLFPDSHGLPSDEDDLVDAPGLFERELRRVVEIEPGRYAANRDPSDVLMFRASADSFVPTANQDALRSAFSAAGEAPEVKVASGIVAGHYATILFAYRQREEILAFLHERLTPTQRRPAE